MGKRSRETSFSPSVEEPQAVETEADKESSNTESIHPDKYAQVSDSRRSELSPVMQCSLPPHKDHPEFGSYSEYEVHYVKEHTNRCAQCGKNFPSAYFLGLHIEENHNALREALQARGEKTYGCFVEDCERKCSTPQKRRLHLIDKHGFPKFYNFRVVDMGIDRSNSMLRDGHKRRLSVSNDTNRSSRHRRRASTLAQTSSKSSDLPPGPDSGKPRPSAPPTVEPLHNLESSKNPKSVGITLRRPSAAEGIDDLQKSLSALQFVPSSVSMKQSKDASKK